MHEPNVRDGFTDDLVRFDGLVAIVAAGRQMIEQGRGGSIINVVSIGATSVYPHATALNQSKGGVVQLTRSLTRDFMMAPKLIHRRGEPYEMAGPCVFLASQAATMVTGHVLQVDAGYVIA
jgi:NAD(P)-dependent dehydrogenase (short-subunit alcohol dehydrogenase family)